MPLSIFILLAVFFLIIIRRIGNIYLQIWQIMLLGAGAALISGEIRSAAALKAVDIDVMLFLFGMFVVGQALEESGYLAHLSYKIFKSAKSINCLMLYILFGMGAASAILMNDTLAIIGTPVMLLLARKQNMSPKLLLLALAFAVTIGSVLSPIGNPQNLLIALHGDFRNPFLTFFRYLLLPTVLNLVLTLWVLRYFYPDEFHNESLNHSQEPIRDKRLARLSKISLLVILALVAVKIATVFWGGTAHYRLTYIALLGAAPIILFSRRRFEILRKIDWSTLVFFAAMFVLMAAVWESYFFQEWIDRMELDITKLTMILALSIVLSQMISNVPLVALYMPMLQHAGAANNELIALAAGSTIAGNMLILGAASNIIIIQNAEKRAGITLSFWEFARVGVPLTVINAVVYWVFLRVM